MLSLIKPVLRMNLNQKYGVFYRNLLDLYSSKFMFYFLAWFKLLNNLGSYLRRIEKRNM